MRVLIVDDNQRIRKAVREHLGELGSQLESVAECGDGTSAVEIFREFHPTWVLMDIRLPSIDGLEATRRILHEDPKANVLIITQYDEPVYREEARAIGVRGYVLKEDLDSVPGIILSQSQTDVTTIKHTWRPQ